MATDRPRLAGSHMDGRHRNRQTRRPCFFFSVVLRRFIRRHSRADAQGYRQIPPRQTRTRLSLGHIQGITAAAGRPARGSNTAFLTNLFWMGKPKKKLPQNSKIDKNERKKITKYYAASYAIPEVWVTKNVRGGLIRPDPPPPPFS